MGKIVSPKRKRAGSVLLALVVATASFSGYKLYEKNQPVGHHVPYYDTVATVIAKRPTQVRWLEQRDPLCKDLLGFYYEDKVVLCRKAYIALQRGDPMGILTFTHELGHARGHRAEYRAQCFALRNVKRVTRSLFKYLSPQAVYEWSIAYHYLLNPEYQFDPLGKRHCP